MLFFMHEFYTSNSVVIFDILAKFYGNNIKYVGIQVNTTLRYQTLGYTEGVPIMDKWEEFVKSEVGIRDVRHLFCKVKCEQWSRFLATLQKS